jgi:hypothetical protein
MVSIEARLRMAEAQQKRWAKKKSYEGWLQRRNVKFVGSALSCHS